MIAFNKTLFTIFVFSILATIRVVHLMEQNLLANTLYSMFFYDPNLSDFIFFNFYGVYAVKKFKVHSFMTRAFVTLLRKYY